VADSDPAELPFSPLDWAHIVASFRAVVIARSADPGLGLARYRELRALLDELTGRYDDHPVLLQIAADYAPRCPEREFLYSEALRRAEETGYPRYLIRLSWAQVLIQERDFHTAEFHLDLAWWEVHTLALPSERLLHRQLRRLCRRRRRFGDLFGPE